MEQICQHLFVGIAMLSFNESMAALFWMFCLRPLNTCTRSCECQDGSDASAYQFSPQFHGISWDFLLEHMEEEMSMGASWDFMRIFFWINTISEAPVR